MSIDSHWGRARNVLIEAFKDTKDSKSKGEDPLEVAEKQLQNITESLQNQKTTEAVQHIFSGFPELGAFHDASQEKLKSIRQAAKLLQGDRRGYDQDVLDNVKGVYTERILELARASEPRGGPDRLIRIGNTLEAYSERLEDIYKHIEEDLTGALLLDIREVKVSQWAKSLEETYKQAVAKKRLVEDIQQNFEEGNVRLSLGGGPIAFPENKRSSFEDYLRKDIVPLLLDGMGVEEHSEEAQAILSSFQDKDFQQFMFHLNHLGSEEAEKLKFVLTCMGNQIADEAGTYLVALASSADPKRRFFPARLEERKIEVHLTPAKSPEIRVREIHDPQKFGKNTKIELHSHYTPNMKTEGGLNADFSATLIGWELDRDLERMQETFKLGGLPCKVIDEAEPADAPLLAAAAIGDVERKTAEGVSIATLQVLEGKPTTREERTVMVDGEPVEEEALTTSFYIGTITPTEFLEKAVGIATDTGIPKDAISLPAQAHMTVVPPSVLIDPSNDIGKIAKRFQPIELEFDSITISKWRNINLWASSDTEYQSASKILAEAINPKLKPTDRSAHSKIGMVSQEMVDKIFADPKKYGFEVVEGKEDRLVRMKLPESLKLRVETSEGLPLHQRLLNIQFQAGGMSLEEAQQMREDFQLRVQRVQTEQEKIKTEEDYQFEGVKTIRRGDAVEFKKYTQPPPFKTKHLDLAVNGDPKVGRVPLNFSCRRNGVELWLQFKKEVRELFDRHKITDAKVQILGSGVHGFSRNPNKDFKLWNTDSDVDLAIFSEQLADRCLREGVVYNQKIKMFGKFTVFKNECAADAEGIGFHDTAIGREIAKLMEKWSIKLYGPSCPPDHVDFKMNIGQQPFSDEGTIGVLGF